MRTKICTGSLMDGMSIDVVRWCGFSDLSDEQYDHLWNSITEIGLFEDCGSCEVIETGDIDEVPGQSDVFFKVVTDDVDQCRNEVKTKINQIIGELKK